MLKFLKITAEQYAALASKDQDVFYYVGGEKLYLGNKELTTEAEVKTAVSLVNDGTKGNEALYSDLQTLIGTTLPALKAEIEGEVVNTLAAADDSVTVGGTATARTVGVKISSKTGNNLSLETTEGEEGLYVNVPTQTDYTVSITKTAGGSKDPYSARYTVTQTASGLNQNIDIPKDMVVEEGSVADITYSEGHLYDGVTDVTEIIKGEGGTATAADAGKYIKLIIANSSSDVLYIAAESLVDVYTVEANAEKIQLAIDANNEISADVVTGSIELTDLESDVQTSLGKADSAVQSIATGTTNGTISVDGTEVSVAGLGSAAYTASTDYDASGSAAAAKAEVIGESGDAASASTIYGAKAYADSLSVNYDAAGAAATAKSEVIGTSGDAASANTIYGAKAYADSLVLNWKTYSAE